MSAGYEGPKVTKQGYEMCMGTNYFGHFMLTSLLLPALQKGKGDVSRRRVIERDVVVRVEQVSLFRERTVENERELLGE